MAAVVAAGAGELEVTAYLWPDNVATWRHWQAVQTQWRVGPTGATGLDYAGVRAYLADHGLQAAERRSIFRGIQAAEVGALEAWQDRARNRVDKPGH